MTGTIGATDAPTASGFDSVARTGTPVELSIVLPLAAPAATLVNGFVAGDSVGNPPNPWH